MFVVHNIQWDFETVHRTRLPKSILVVNIPQQAFDELGQMTDEYEQLISDHISDVYGFCHKGFDLDEVRPDTPMRKSCTISSDFPIDAVMQAPSIRD